MSGFMGIHLGFCELYFHLNLISKNIDSNHKMTPSLQDLCWQLCGKYRIFPVILRIFVQFNQTGVFMQFMVEKCCNDKASSVNCRR